MKVDRVEDFVLESWGELRSAVLGALERLLVAVVTARREASFKEYLASIKTGQVSQCTFIANRYNLAINAICPSSMWKDLNACILWIVDVIGQPETDGLYRREPFKYVTADV